MSDASDNEDVKVTSKSKSSVRWAEQLRYVSAISKPLAGRKETKHILKMVKKAAVEKAIRRGVKEVVKAVKKPLNGICIIAGDISPMDVITHLPVLCEDSNIKYIYVPSKEDLGAASLTKRPTSCVFVCKPEDNSSHKKAYDQVYSEIKSAWKSYKR